MTLLKCLLLLVDLSLSIGVEAAEDKVAQSLRDVRADEHPRFHPAAVRARVTREIDQDELARLACFPQGSRMIVENPLMPDGFRTGARRERRRFRRADFFRWEKCLQLKECSFAGSPGNPAGNYDTHDYRERARR